MTREWIPTPSQKDEYAKAAYQLTLAGGQVVRILCPQRHFITEMSVWTTERAPNDISFQPKGGRTHGFSQGDSGPDATAPKVLLTCRKTAHSYRGDYNHFKFGSLLGAAILAGQREVVLQS